ncbi:MAG: electron transport complex subunit RsxC [Spirochaetes bacterium]|nr:electron transport complex subunit RsxC [Spirochaetota bacterium]
MFFSRFIAGFKGGIHPPENKFYSEGKKFSYLPIPHVCYVPLQQHIGKPARPIVEVGQAVEEGQLIGEADGFISANVHSPVPGKVIDIVHHPTVFSPKSLCIVIETEGAFTSSQQSRVPSSWESFSRDELIASIKEAGIVGLGGAAFPTHVKLSPPATKPIDTLIVNGAECEPYLTVDDMLMQTFPHEIIEGIRIAMKTLGVERAIIGVEDNKPDAIRALRKVLLETNAPTITLVSLKTKYPQGAEKQLIKALLRREVPSGGLPMDVGVVVQNVGTIYAIREAVLYKKPLYERFITISGPIVKNPGNYKVRFGTKISDIIDEIGGLLDEPVKVIMGGPMCGIALDTLEIPVVKGTSGVLFFGKNKIESENFLTCIRCGRCVAACPAGLLPCDISILVEKNLTDALAMYHLFDCIMCGSCSFVCPSKRPISHFIKLGQQRLKSASTRMT